MFLSSPVVPTSPFASSHLAISSSYQSAIENKFNTQIRDLKTLFEETQYGSLGRTLNSSTINDSMNSTLNLTDDSQSQYDANHIITQSAPIYTDENTLETTIAIVVPILFSLIFVIGLFGNALVVIVVTFNASMRSTTNILILNLAIADLLFILFCVPFTASDYALSYWPFGLVWCKAVQYLILVLACASNYTLVLMSLDRYLAVVHPINSMSIRNAKNAYIAIFLTWIFIIAACIPAIQTHTIVKYGDNVNDTFLSCTFNSTSNLTHTQFQLGFMISSYLIPLLIAFALYFLMLKKLWLGSSNVNSRLNNVRCRKRVTRMVIIVVLTFALCWAPIQIILVLKSLNMYRTDRPIDIVMQIASQVLAYMNSCVNPILYAFLSENFRKAFHKIIACNLRGIYGANQSSYMQQTGQTSVVHSNYLAPVQTNSQLKRIDIPNKPPRPSDLNNNVNNDANDTPDMAESNRCLKSVNFSIIADGGLFPGNKQQDYLNRHSPSPTTDDQRSGDTTATLNKPINAKPILSSKGRFKCLDDEIVDEFVHTMELHSTNDESENDFIPMYELNKKTVPSVLNDSSAHEPTTTNETMNRTNGNINNSTTTTTASTAGLTTVTTMSNVGSNGVFL